MLTNKAFKNSKRFFIITMALLLSLQGFFITDLTKVEAKDNNNELVELETDEEAKSNKIEGSLTNEMEPMLYGDSTG